MCTIMTFDYDTFTANKEAILATIKSDATSNDDGWNIILAGKYDKDILFTQCLKLDWITDILEGSEFRRFWLHARRSTTKTQGISGCHGFRSYTGWFVQHNGILRSGRADKLPVDSMVISELLEFMTPNHVAQWLLAKEEYANVFMINPTDGVYHTVRCNQGSLHTDSRGNYSSSRIQGVCESPVPNAYHSTNTFVVERKVPEYQYQSYHSYRTHDSRWDKRWDWETNDWTKPSVTSNVEPKQLTSVVTPTPTPKQNKRVEIDSIEEEVWEQLTTEECIEFIPHLSFDELTAVFYARAWDTIGVPKDISSALPRKYVNWLTRIARRSKKGGVAV